MRTTAMGWFAAGPVPRKYTVEIEGLTLEAKTVGDLFTAYSRKVRADGRTLDPGWEEALWRALGKAYPHHVKQTGLPAPPGVSVATAASFLTFMLKRLRNRSLVPLSVSEQRAAVCRSCPMAQPILGCSICRDALKFVVKGVKEADAPPACGACGCYLPLKVWLPRELLGSEDDHPYDPSCWMRSESAVITE